MRTFIFLLILVLIFIALVPPVISIIFFIAFPFFMAFITWRATHKQSNRSPKAASTKVPVSTRPSPVSSAKRATMTPSYFVSQYNHLLEDSYDILTTTNNPKTFRSRLDFCTQKLDELQHSYDTPEAHRIYDYYHPLITGDNLSTLISDCRSRYYDKAISELKTASRIEKRMQSFDAIIGVTPAPASTACVPSASPQISAPTSHQYITEGNVTFHTDGSPITDDEIPYLIELGKEHARETEKNSPNPKFHRTEIEKDLSFKFYEQYFDEAGMAEAIIYDKVQAASGAYIRWSKTASIKEIEQKIALLDEAITAYEDFKKFCYSKGDGGQIFFDDRWEYCHNSKNPCFSYIQSVLDEKAFLLQKIAEKQG